MVIAPKVYVAWIDPGQHAPNHQAAVIALTLEGAAEHAAACCEAGETVARLDYLNMPVWVHQDVAASLGAPGWSLARPREEALGPPGVSVERTLPVSALTLPEESVEAILDAARLAPVSPPGMTKARIERAVQAALILVTRGMREGR